MGKRPKGAGGRKSPWRTILTILGSIVATLTVVATAIENSETVGKFVLAWLSPLVQTKVAFVLKLDAEADGPLHVNIADAENLGRPFDFAAINNGETATFNVAIGARYVLSWEGAGFQANAMPPRNADGARRWILQYKEKGEEGIVLKAVEEISGKEVATQPAQAETLIATSGQDRKASGAVSQLLPELDRALATIGLLEIGSTDCTRRNYVIEGEIGAGCLGVSMPGVLADLLRDLDRRVPGLLDETFGEDAAFIRNAAGQDSFGAQRAAMESLKGDKSKQFRLRLALVKLAATVDFRQAYQEIAGRFYGHAVETARSLHLQSERGVLFVLDRKIQQGGSWLGKVKADYFAAESGFAPGDDRKRIALLAQLIKASVADKPLARQISDRIDTIVSGKKVLRSIAFDLDSMGILYEAMVVPMVEAPPPALPPSIYLVFFDSQSDKVNKSGLNILERVAAAWQATPQSRITLIGHTDRSGDATANLDLSRRMAEAVKTALVAAGVDPGKVEVQFKGETDNAIPTADEVKEQVNRRVEILLQPQEP